MRIASILACVSALLVSACDSNPGGSGGADAPTSSGGPSCSSFTLCTNSEVRTYAPPSLGVPGGGSITPGLYRLAWIETNDPDRDGIFDDLVVLELRGASFNWSGGVEGEVGTFVASGTDLALHYTARCELGTQTQTDDRDVAYAYTATGSELRLYETVGAVELVHVFQRMADPSEACVLVSAPPSMAGDSATCNAFSCFCSFATEDTLDASSCPF